MQHLRVDSCGFLCVCVSLRSPPEPAHAVGLNSKIPLESSAHGRGRFLIPMSLSLSMTPPLSVPGRVCPSWALSLFLFLCHLSIFSARIQGLVSPNLSLPSQESSRRSIFPVCELSSVFNVTSLSESLRVAGFTLISDTVRSYLI